MKPQKRQALLWLVGVSVALSCSSMTAQTAKPHRSGAASYSKQPDKAQTFIWIRSKLLALSPEDGINNNTTVSFDGSTCKLSVTNAKGQTGIAELSHLDASSAVWDIFDSSPDSSPHKNPLILRLSLEAIPDKSAGIISQSGKSDRQMQAGTLSFSMRLIADTPEVREKITKAMKHLVTLCGGVPDTMPF